jgi:hypothetical protein
MRDIYADYYFLDENCSYDLLFLVEAARPSARLTDRNRGFFVTPIETLRSVLAEGLADNVVFRPSAARKIRQKASMAGKEDTVLARSLALGEAEPAAVTEGPFPGPDKAVTLDVASDFTHYLYLKEEIPKDVYQKRYLGILTARSGIAGPPPDYPPIPVPPPPQSGHPTSRATLSAGSRGGDPFLEIAYRPAYHSLDDPAEGFSEGAQIVFSEAAARWYPGDGRVRLQEWDLIDIVSISPRDTLFRPASWKVRTGFTTRDFPGDVETLVYALNPGGGLAWKVSPLGLLYFLAETELDLSDRYDHWYTVSLGGSAGILRQAIDRWGFLAQVRYVYGVLGDTEQGRRFTASISVPYRVAPNHSIVLEGKMTDTPGVRTDAFRLSWNYYF